MKPIEQTAFFARFCRVAALAAMTAAAGSAPALGQEAVGGAGKAAASPALPALTPAVVSTGSGLQGGGRLGAVALAAGARGQTRLYPLETTVEDHHGLAGWVFERRSKPAGILQLFNPFAPASEGNASVGYFERPASVRDGCGPVRKAVSDYGPYQPSGLFFSARW